MQEFGTYAEDGGADKEGEIQVAPATGVKDPVEACCEYEECYDVEDFVIDYGVNLEGAEAEVGGGKKEEDEGSCVASELNSGTFTGIHKLYRDLQTCKGQPNAHDDKF